MEELYPKADSEGSDTKGEAITVTAVGDDNETDSCYLFCAELLSHLN